MAGSGPADPGSNPGGAILLSLNLKISNPLINNGR
tara:strand:+ start:421 stop:525 length:105 start_codon:yes stop_codon:yes gene_type:complete